MREIIQRREEEFAMSEIIQRRGEEFATSEMICGREEEIAERDNPEKAGGICQAK